MVVPDGWRSNEIDAVPGRGDIFAVALGTATRPGEPPAVMKDELAIVAARRFQNKPAGLVMRDGFHDVFEMILDLPLGNAEHLGQLMRRQARADQQVDHALARSSWGIEHGRIVIQRHRKTKLGAGGTCALHSG